MNFELYEGRIDHVFNDKHRMSLVLNQQSFHSINVAAPPPYPLAPWQDDPTETTQYSVTFNSVLKPTLINEVKIGVFRPRTLVKTPYDPGEVGPNTPVVGHIAVDGGRPGSGARVRCTLERGHAERGPRAR